MRRCKAGVNQRDTKGKVERGARGLAGSKRGRLELPAAAVAVETVPAARGPEACNGGSRNAAEWS